MSEVQEGVDALLMDGRIVHVRRVSDGDKEALSVLYTRASPRDTSLGFFLHRISITVASQGPEDLARRRIGPFVTSDCDLRHWLAPTEAGEGG
jgi:hypothetical protein